MESTLTNERKEETLTNERKSSFTSIYLLCMYNPFYHEDKGVATIHSPLNGY